jgi:type II secretory pathway pseudopilin PulG
MFLLLLSRYLPEIPPSILSIFIFIIIFVFVWKIIIKKYHPKIDARIDIGKSVLFITLFYVFLLTFSFSSISLVPAKPYYNAGRIAATKTYLTLIDSALEMFRSDFGRIPSGGSNPQEGFIEMVRVLTNEEACAKWLIKIGEHITGVNDPIFVEKWHGPYLKQKDPYKFLDGWRNTFNYIQGRGGNKNAYMLWSNGPDGINNNGEGDDIVSSSSNF